MRNQSENALRLVVGILLVAASGLSGCSSLEDASYGCSIPAVDASRLPPELLGRSRNDMQQISISRLRQDPPAVYQLGPNDILGIFVENALGEDGEAPPVHFSEEGDQPPALGYPVPVRGDGTVNLPLIDPVPVAGLTLDQAEEAIVTAYLTAKPKPILQPGQNKVIVTLMRRREYRVLVIREEAGGTVAAGGAAVQQVSLKRGTGDTVDLPAYENDVLHALNETGGLPGLDAENAVYILRGGFADGARRDALIAQLRACLGPCECPPPIPPDPNIVVIPIRFYPENPPQFTQKDIILQTGDVVYIPARDRDKFYTGGVLPGGEHLLPRDYDVDVLGAIAIAGGPLGSGGSGISQVGGGGGGGIRGQSTGKNPSEMIIVRKLPCGGQIPIRVDLNRALVDGSERILVQPEDTLILRYTCAEEVYNAALNMVSFNFLFNGFSGGGF